MWCSDGNYYVVKFQNNPQHRRILVNELLGTRLASRLGLPTAPAEVVEVSAELIRFEKLGEVGNLHDFAGMLVFDKWTCNTNGRQTVFFEEPAPPAERKAESAGGQEKAARAYRTVMIDQGFCFNAGEWSFPDAPLRGSQISAIRKQGFVPC
jgi:hypothetical protein